MNVKNHDFPRGLGVPLLCVQGINNVTKADVILVMFYERIDKDRVFELNSSDYSIASIKYVFYDHLGEFVAYALGSELNGNVFDEQSREIAKYNLKATKTENKNSKNKICSLLKKNITKILINELKHSMSFYGVSPSKWQLLLNNSDCCNKQYILSKYKEIIKTNCPPPKQKTYQWLFTST